MGQYAAYMHALTAPVQQHNTADASWKKPVGKQLQDTIESALTAPNGASLKPKGLAFCFPRRSNPEDIADFTNNLQQRISKEHNNTKWSGSGLNFNKTSYFEEGLCNFYYIYLEPRL